MHDKMRKWILGTVNCNGGNIQQKSGGVVLYSFANMHLKMRLQNVDNFVETSDLYVLIECL